MTRRILALALGAGLTAAVAATGALAEDTPAAKPGAVAYPNNPSGTPQADNAGAPVVTDKAACATPGKCPDKPQPSASADTATTGSNQAQSGGVATPATAYPKSPVPTPATKSDGSAPN